MLLGSKSEFTPDTWDIFASRNSAPILRLSKLTMAIPSSASSNLRNTWKILPLMKAVSLANRSLHARKRRAAYFSPFSDSILGWI
jgi:hypothetical protein